MRVVQVTITMLPDGSLCMERPYQGGRIQTPVSDFETIRRALAAQLHNRADTIGTDGKPTTAQVRHWEDHLERVMPDGTLSIGKLNPDTCVWCLAHTMGLSTDERAHKRARAILKEQRRISSHPFTMGDGSVTVRRVPKSASSKSKKPIQSTLVMDFDEDFFQEEL
jgi:hypothetical protein